MTHRKPAAKTTLNDLRKLVSEDLLGHLAIASQDDQKRVGELLDDWADRLCKEVGLDFVDDDVGLSEFATGQLTERPSEDSEEEDEDLEEDLTLTAVHQRFVSGTANREGLLPLDQIGFDLAFARALREEPRRLFAPEVLERIYALTTIANPANHFAPTDQALAWELLLRYLGALLPPTEGPKGDVVDTADAIAQESMSHHPTKRVIEQLERTWIVSYQGRLRSRPPDVGDVKKRYEQILVDAEALWAELNNLKGTKKERDSAMHKLAVRYGIPEKDEHKLRRADRLERIRNLLADVRTGIGISALQSAVYGLPEQD